jgi:hypothetical protein
MTCHKLSLRLSRQIEPMRVSQRMTCVKFCVTAWIWHTGIPYFV